MLKLSVPNSLHLCSDSLNTRNSQHFSFALQYFFFYFGVYFIVQFLTPITGECFHLSSEIPQYNGTKFGADHES